MLQLHPSCSMLARLLVRRRHAVSDWMITTTLLTAGTLLAQVAGTTVQELGPLTPVRNFAVSPDGRRVAVVVQKGSRQAVSLDGNVQNEVFDQIPNFRITVAHGQPERMTPFVFSPDGLSYAFMGERSGQQTLYVNGKAAGPAGLANYASASTLQFSGNSKRYAYVLSPIGPDGKQEGLPERNQLTSALRVVVDGTVGPAFGGIQDLQFSADSRRVAYVGVGGEYTVMLDGQKTGSCYRVENLKFSADGKRLAYTCVTPQQPANMGLVRKKVVVDGKADPRDYSAIHHFQWSTSESHYAYTGTDDPNRSDTPVKHEVVVDGAVKNELRAPIANISALSLSPDGKRYGYVALLKTSNAIAVVDGKPSMEYRTIGGVVFSRDGRHSAFFATAPSGIFLVLDGEESSGPLIPGSQAWYFDRREGLFYLLPRKAGANWKLFVEGGGAAVELPVEVTPDSMLARTGPASAALSPDGKRIAYPDNMGLLAVDGKILDDDLRLGEFASHFSGAGTDSAGNRRKLLFSPDGNHLAFVGITGNKTGYVKSELFIDRAGMANEVPAAGNFLMPVFSSDSKHFAHAGPAKLTGHPTGAQMLMPPQRIYLNGASGPTVDQLFSDMPETFQFVDGRLQVIAAKDGQLQRYTIDPGSTSIADFAANAAKTKAPQQSGSPTPPANTPKAQQDLEKAKQTATNPVDAAKNKAKEKIGGWLKKGK